jgi:NAD(P)-dependent dehydrogenase (short-subunit alcohol dehydrogenase family)
MTQPFRIVLSGSSTGIGRALAERLLARGQQVWGLARSDQTDFAVRYSGRFRSTRCDVGDWAQVAAAAGEILREWPAIDGLVTCAGSQGEIGRAVTADPERWSDTVRDNLDGTFFAIRGLHEALRRAPRRAKIVCFSGGGATKSRPNFSAYAVAKSGVVRLVETIAEEERDSRLDINAVAPGAINTRMTNEVIALGPDVVGTDEYHEALKLNAQGAPSFEKVLGIVEWLLSPASDGISGRLLSAEWDPWPTLGAHTAELAASDIYTLRRITPRDRGEKWD